MKINVVKEKMRSIASDLLLAVVCDNDSKALIKEIKTANDQLSAILAEAEITEK